jgi:hypothetical protein
MMTVTIPGKRVVLDDLAAARAKKALTTRLAELRYAAPSLRIEENFGGVVAVVAFPDDGRMTQVLVDPSNLLEL